MEPVQQVVERLEHRGLLLESCEDSPGYIPARDIETISLEEVIGAVRSPVEDAKIIEERYISLPGVDEISRGIEEGMKAALGGRTVKDLVQDGAGDKNASEVPARP